MDKRLNHVESEFIGFRGEISNLRKEIASNFRWTMGIMITMWVTIILTIIFGV